LIFFHSCCVNCLNAVVVDAAVLPPLITACGLPPPLPLPLLPRRVLPPLLLLRLTASVGFDCDALARLASRRAFDVAVRLADAAAASFSAFTTIGKVRGLRSLHCAC
jgi:hypothetical protein